MGSVLIYCEVQLCGLQAVSLPLGLPDSSRSEASVTPGMKAEMAKTIVTLEKVVCHLRYTSVRLLFTS